MLRHFEGLLWSLAVICLILAAMVTDRRVLLAVAVIWLLSVAIVIPLHLWKAWRRLPTVVNKTGYAVWVGFETMCVAAFIVFCVHGLISH